MKQSKLFDIQAMILDMDGVLWRDNAPIVNLPETFSEIERLGISVVLATNNSSRSPEQYRQKLLGFGVDLERKLIVNSAEACAKYLVDRYPDGGPVYILGEDGLIKTLANNGFYHDEDNVLAVIVGLDHGISYPKLRKATLLIRSSVPFIGTNPDRTFPTPFGLEPGAGALIAAIQAATDVEPVIIGKPAPEMYRTALERLKVKPRDTLVVGDRLETDIAGGQALGCRTALVLSGVTDKESANAWRPPPDIIASDLQEVLNNLRALR